MNTFVVSIIVLLIAMASVQSGAALAKTLFPILGPGGLTAMRVGFAAIILCSVFRPWRGKKLHRRDLWLITGYGASLGLMNFFFYFALERIPLGIAVALEFAGPLGLALLVSRKAADYFWALLAAAGIFLIMPHSIAVQALDPVGIFYALLAGLCWGFYIYFGQRASSRIKATTIVSLGMFVAAVICIVLGICQSGARIFNFSVLPQAIGVAVLSSVLPYSLEMVALKNLTTQVFGILMSLEPAFAALCGFIFIHEKLSLTQGFAILLVIVASVGVSLGAKKKKVPAVAPLA